MSLLSSTNIHSNASRSWTGTRSKRRKRSSRAYMYHLSMMRISISTGATIRYARLYHAQIYSLWFILGRRRMWSTLGGRNVLSYFNWFAISIKMTINMEQNFCSCDQTRGRLWISQLSIIGCTRFHQLNSRPLMSRMPVIMGLSISGKTFP